jgi:hypothetical protein
MFKGEVQSTPDQALPYRAVVWREGQVERAKPAASYREAERALVRLLAEARSFA